MKACLRQPASPEIHCDERLRNCLKLRVFVAEGVEAVRAPSNDLFDAVAVQGFNVVLGHHFKQEFVADAPRGSPVHFSSRPRIANFTPAFSSNCAVARTT